MKNTFSADSIAFAQVRGLRREAVEAGDIVQQVICDVALGEADDETVEDYSGGGHSVREMRGISDALEMTQEQAWQACADAINARQAES